ncbi:MAG: sulfotransferase domain-containing protein [Actinomycetota bacterium]|jgi:hypothetical protein|nr:sulfotransferase domain-containing protein [Actinomycetota bacterium]
MMKALLHLKSVAKRSPAARRAYLRLRGGVHSARLKILRKKARSGASSRRLDPERIVWIFCTSRSGSTWLKNIVADLVPSKVWEEPKVGCLFGDFHDGAQKGQLASTHFVMGEPNRPVWIESIRNFTLDAAEAALPSIKPGEHLIIKEPDGALGARLLMDAIPESRMILLVRDPRDVAASALDGIKKGNWMFAAQDKRGQGSLAAHDPVAHTKARAASYLKHIGNAKKAYDEHDGHKTIVRYEDLLADTAKTIGRVCREIGLSVDEATIGRVVEKHSWKNVPGNQKGEGKFFRKGASGGWREDLTPEQAGIVEEATKPLLQKFYPEG